MSRKTTSSCRADSESTIIERQAVCRKTVALRSGGWVRLSGTVGRPREQGSQSADESRRATVGENSSEGRVRLGGLLLKRGGAGARAPAQALRKSGSQSPPPTRNEEDTNQQTGETPNTEFDQFPSP